MAQLVTEEVPASAGTSGRCEMTWRGRDMALDRSVYRRHRCGENPGKLHTHRCRYCSGTMHDD